MEDQKSEKCSGKSRSQGNINLVSEDVAEDTEMSIRQRSHQVVVSELHHDIFHTGI